MTCCPDASHQLSLQLGSGLWTALQERCRRTGETPEHVIRSALAESLDLEHHTIYRVHLRCACAGGVRRLRERGRSAPAR